MMRDVHAELNRVVRQVMGDLPPIRIECYREHFTQTDVVSVFADFATAEAAVDAAWELNR